MGNVLVQYYSQTGRTEEMAVLVAEGASTVKNIDVRLKRLDDTTADDILWCDGIALGAPTHLGSVPWRLKQWWDDVVGDVWLQVDGKFGCSFSSCGGLGGGAELACMELMTILMNFGFLTFGVTDYVATMHTLHYGAALPGRPKTEAEKEICRRLGVRLAEWVSFYVDGMAESHPRHAAYSRRA